MTEAVSASGPVVILVVGRPASGKTTISRVIAERWGLPLVAKDALKETLFDSLGVGDREWSIRLGRAAFALLERVIELQLQTGTPFVVDAAYDARHEDGTFRAWQERFGFTAVQVHCVASSATLERRFVERSGDGSRHPGHGAVVSVDGYRAALDDDRVDLLNVRGPVIEVDTELEGSTARALAALETLIDGGRGSSSP